MRPTLAHLAPLFAATLLLGSGSASGARPGVDASLAFGERVEVSVVNVEVFVTDAKGRRVENLGRDDFRIFEDGKPVPITNFYAVGRGDRAAEPPAATTAPAAGASSTEPAPKPPEQRLNLVVYFDNSNLAPFDRTRVTKDVAGFLEDRLDEGDRVMVVAFDGTLKIFQGLTEDRARIDEALARLAKQGAGKLDETASYRRVESELRAAKGSGNREAAFATVRSYVQQRHDARRRELAALENVVRATSSLPGRKALLYVSDGFPQSPGVALYQEASQVSSSGGESFSSAGAGGLTRSPLGPFGGNSRADAHRPELDAIRDEETQLMAELTRTANAHQVTFYTLDARGLLAHGGPTVETADSLADAGPIPSLSGETINTQEPLLRMADATGGQAIVGTSNFDDALDGVGHDFDSFYSLGYASSHHGDGKYHKISVEVSDPSWRVRHREGYLDEPEEKRIGDRTLSALLLDLEKNPLGVSVAFGQARRKSRDKYLLPVVVRIPTGKIALLPADGEHRGMLRIDIAVEGETGATSEVFQASYPVRVADAELTAAEDRDIAYATELLIRPGRPQVAIGVHDDVGGQESFVLTDVVVGGK